jgi:hypothetical protein
MFKAVVLALTVLAAATVNARADRYPSRVVAGIAE